VLGTRDTYKSGSALSPLLAGGRQGGLWVLRPAKPGEIPTHLWP
jgi:hypothetical protein